ncbi:MAG: SCO family protein [Thiohalophilus sp.]|uniref:SCO family protein n=1 Tax=Thiohalophilus sp. TaxID=3028392 RepID=UPI0028701B8E|nr:SCO family protein [Thiohalophilus sp.]MDR9435475.1 SCO family protein [Thiohalophilus sp.]
MQNMNVSKAERNKGRRDFLLLVAVFFLPIIIVLVLYFNLDKWDIGGERNHGDLIQPPRQLKDIALTDQEGSSFRFSDVRDKWLMLHFGGASCNPECVEELYLMRQIRLAQGGNRQRLVRIHISTEGAPQESLRNVLADHPDLKIVYGDDPSLQKVIDQFEHDTGAGPSVQSMYLVDPRGYLMMSYPEDYEPKGAIRDLERLLKFARSG